MFYFDYEWHMRGLETATLAMLRMDREEAKRRQANKEKTRG